MSRKGETFFRRLARERTGDDFYADVFGPATPAAIDFLELRQSLSDLSVDNNSSCRSSFSPRHRIDAIPPTDPDLSSTRLPIAAAAANDSPMDKQQPKEEEDEERECELYWERLCWRAKARELRSAVPASAGGSDKAPSSANTDRLRRRKKAATAVVLFQPDGCDTPEFFKNMAFVDPLTLDDDDDDDDEEDEEGDEEDEDEDEEDYGCNDDKENAEEDLELSPIRLKAENNSNSCSAASWTKTPARTPVTLLRMRYQQRLEQQLQQQEEHQQPHQQQQQQQQEPQEQEHDQTRRVVSFALSSSSSPQSMPRSPGFNASRQLSFTSSPSNMQL